MKVLAIIMDSGQNPLLQESMQWLKQLFAEKGIEVSEICIENDSLKGCVACGKCYRAGKCIFDDEVNTVIRQMADCDGMVVGGESRLAHNHTALVIISRDPFRRGISVQLFPGRMRWGLFHV